MSLGFSTCVVHGISPSRSRVGFGEEMGMFESTMEHEYKSDK